MEHQLSKTAPENSLLVLWKRLSGWPLGPRIFSFVFGWKVPYSGSIRPLIRELEPGHAVIQLKDRRGVRQHLGSVHAVALCNLGEMTSGLAMIAALPPSVRGIVTRIEIEFLKKARGLLTATSDARPPDSVTESIDHPVQAEIVDESGEVVSRVTVHWRLGPRPR